jgi:hypothetical protein
MPKRLKGRLSRSIRERPRNGRVWLAVAIVIALTFATNLVLVFWALGVPSLGGPNSGALKFALLIGPVTNVVLAVACFAGTWIVRRISVRASVIPYVIFSIALPLFAIIADFVFIVINTGTDSIEIRRRMIVGNELRLIVETSRRERSFMSHSSKTADAKGYFIRVDLSSSEPLAKRARVYGPLWDVPTSRSSLSFTAGPEFTKVDVEAHRATPMCVFDTDGTLLKFTTGRARKVLVREAFVAVPDGGSWQPQGEVRPADDHLEPMSHDRLLTASGRFILLYQKGEAKLFDLFTGEAKDDPWLTQCFAQARSNKDLKYARLVVTDDLNYLVIIPMKILNRGQPEIQTFQQNGKTYDCAEFGLAYSRPDPSPKVFSRTKEEQKRDAPDGAYSIDGDLYLYSLIESARSLCLHTPDGKKDFRVQRDDAPGRFAWELSAPFADIQHVPEKDELIIPDHTSEIHAKDGIHATVCMIRWNYKKSTTTRQDTPIVELFKRSGGQLRPRSPIAVK